MRYCKAEKMIRLTVFLLAVANVWAISDFAAEVIDVHGTFSSEAVYNDPSAILGKPATQCKNKPGVGPFQLPPSFRVKLVEAPYYTSLDDQPVVMTIEGESYITVKFDHKVMDFPLNPYGQDFIVFGNAFFQHSEPVEISDAANMNQITLTNPATFLFGEVYVSVSQDGQTWYMFDRGPWADDLYPTQAYRWDRDNAQWTDEEMDFTKPVDPNLGLSVFDGLSAADAIDLYDGSAGGTPFDLKDLADYDELVVDPNSGCRWIQYVRLGGGPYPMGGEVDAVSDVAVCGDPTHPYPAGDITKDCRVDLEDFAVLSASWLECTYKCDE